MARYTDPVCRLCRREGIKLFLKGSKCFSDKCPIEKRNFAPGQHGKDRKTKIVGYGLQLREKQKAKRIYFTQEGQFRNYFEKAARTRASPANCSCSSSSAVSTTLSSGSDLACPPSGAPVGASRTRPGERTQGQHSVVPGECGRGDYDSEKQPQAGDSGSRRRNSPATRIRRPGWRLTATTTKEKSCRCRSAKTSSSRSMSS